MSKKNNTSFFKTAFQPGIRLFIPFVILIILIIATFFAWTATKNYVNFVKQEEFDDAVREVVIRAEDTINTYMDIIFGARGLFAASKSVERDEWNKYVNSLNLEHILPGIQALSFVERISLEEKEDFILRTRSDTSIFAEGYPGFTIYPEEDRKEYFVVNYIEPFLGNEPAFGFNLGSSAARLQALENARDSGLPIATEPIRLVQETKEQAGFLIFLPVYKNDAPVNVLEERQKALQGFISAVFRVEDLLSEILSNVSTVENIYIEIFDSSMDTKLTKDSELYKYKHVNPSYQPKFFSEKEINVFGRKWNLHFEDLQEFGVESGTNKALPWLVLAGGLIFSFLIFAVIYSFLRTKSRAIQLAQELTVDLKKFQLAVENASDHIVITDAVGNILYANIAAEKITGYSKKEMLGHKAGDLWGGHMEKSFYKKMWSAIKEGKKPFVSELTNIRKSGKEYDVQLRISPILDKKDNIAFFVGIERDITKEKEIDRAKSEFVSLASHQLRTPLTSINWYTEMLLSGDAGKLSENQRQFLNEIYEGNKRMVDLVDALLNVSRLELGTFVVEPEDIDLINIIDSVLKELELQIKQKSQKLDKNLNIGAKKYFGDSKLLRIVFQNLLSNAVKYTPEKGAINVELGKNKSDIIFKVTDTGMGIPKEQQQKIFTKLFRADNVKQNDTEGTGLGLYIVKSIIEYSGGKVWFESKENKGTTFYVSLPVDGMKSKKGTKRMT